MALGFQFSRLAVGIMLRLPAVGSGGCGWLGIASLIEASMELGLCL